MTFEHHIFIDFENVREADLGLLEGHSASITLVLGKRQKTMALTMVEALRRLPPDQVKLVQSTVPGRNSLDFVLACLVGRTVEGHPGVSVHIISKDKGFDALIAHLTDCGVPAARHDSLAAVPALSAKTAAATPAAKAPATKRTAREKPVPPLEDRVDCLARRLAKNTASRPQKRSTLATYVKSQLGAKLTDRHVKETIDALTARGVLSVSSAGKVQYPASEPGDAREADDDVPL